MESALLFVWREYGCVLYCCMSSTIYINTLTLIDIKSGASRECLSFHQINLLELQVDTRRGTMSFSLLYTHQ